MSINFWNNMISATGLFVVNFYICKKAVNHKSSDSQKVVSLLWCVVCALIFALEFMPPLMFRVIYCATSIVFVWKLAKIKSDTILPAFLLAFGISYVFYGIAFFIIAVVLSPFLSFDQTPSPEYFNEPIFLIAYASIAMFQFVLAFILFKIRRFKLGFPFLTERYTLIMALIVAGGIAIGGSFVLFQTEGIESFYWILMTIFGVFVIGAGIYIWIRRNIKKHQRKKSWERNEELLSQEKEELTRQLQHYKDMHDAVRIANHKIMHRQAVAERSILKLYERARMYGLPTELSDELALSIDEIRKLSQEYQESVAVKVDKKLPSTNIRTVDEMFELFAERFAGNDIDFNLKVNGSVVYMVNNILEQGKLETMIGDHLQDALVAVKSGNGETRSVLAMIGETDDCYEFSVYDSGIPFEVDTLTRIGLKQITTHEKDGGSGIGFMTTFETMNECGASLIIKENTPGSSFSKKVTIRFDGKKNYVIETYRPDAFPPSDRYTVVGTL